MESSRAPSAPIDLAGRADWSRIFGRRAPLEVEIGAGMGGFALGFAAAHPGVNLVAIEIRKKLAEGIRLKAEKRGLSNLVVLHGDAKVLLPRLFAPRSVDRFHVQFPDPWWKARHHGRRLVEDRFSILLYNLLRVGGTIELRTDVEARGFEMNEALEAIGFVNRHGPGGLAPYDPAQVPSSRERGYLARGQSVYRYELERTEAPPHHALAPLSPTTVGTAQRRR
ncbi:MAG TPA: tRNA (guanosine(46)-N7)-methyltransferase TrmB [Vulgatibacter sp.]|nr:tRNA (guanosine(46)-N7)-methyltransferase TrmB [Vulgatibacter sp.]